MDWLLFFEKEARKRIKIIAIMSEQEIQEFFRWNIPTRKPLPETGKQ